MTWYDQNKIPEWKTFIDNPYNIESVLQDKDLIVKELVQDEVQTYIKTHKEEIIQDTLSLCL